MGGPALSQAEKLTISLIWKSSGFSSFTHFFGHEFYNLGNKIISHSPTPTPSIPRNVKTAPRVGRRFSI